MPDVNLSPYSADIARIEQQRRLAEALQAQSMQPIEQSSVGGIPVKISPFQGLAKMLQASNARSAQMESDKLMRDLYGRAQADKSADLSTFARALQGTPGTPEQWTGEGIDERYTPAVPGMPAGRINPDVLSQLRDPMMQQMAMSLIAKQSEPFNLREGETRFGANNQPIAMNPKADKVIWRDTGNTLTPVMERTGAPAPGLSPIPKSASPDAMLSQEGANQRHLTPSGSALLGSQTTLQTHQTPSGSAILGAQTARRGQDLSVNPDIQGALAQARGYGGEMGKEGATAQMSIPQARTAASQAINIIDQMIGSTDGKIKPHPGFQTAVGATLTPGLRFVEGTDTASFMKMLEQAQGGAFLQAYNSLKGGGAISEIEGKKATSAITRMDKAQSEAEFKAAAREFQDVIRQGLKNLEAKGSPQRRATDRPGAIIDFGSLP